VFAYTQAFKRSVSLMYKKIYNAALPDNKLLSINLDMADNAWVLGDFKYLQQTKFDIQRSMHRNIFL